MMTTGTCKMPPKGHLANNGHLYERAEEGRDRDIQAMNEETVTNNDGGNLHFGSSILIQRQGGYLL